MPERLLKILKENAGEAVSGPDLSGRLGITRAAVWKGIGRLRKKGYGIEGGKHGYKLLSWPGLSEEELSLYLPDKKIVFKQSVPSTNDLAIGLAEKREFSDKGILVVADSQSAGKGRLGRTWSSPPGLNIYMSYLLRPEISPRNAPLLTLAAALSGALALRAQTGLQARLKWPNDLVANGRKLGGILLELRSDPDRIIYAVLGIGINVNAKKEDLPKGIKATSVFIETGRESDRAALIAGIIAELDFWIRAIRKGEHAALVKAYRGISDTIGKNVRLTSEGRRFEGTALNVDEEGRLVIRVAGGGAERQLRFSTGDVTRLRGTA